jgi:hypothetical protein
MPPFQKILCKDCKLKLFIMDVINYFELQGIVCTGLHVLRKGQTSTSFSIQNTGKMSNPTKKLQFSICIQYLTGLFDKHKKYTH